MYVKTEVKHTVADDSNLSDVSPKFAKTRTYEIDGEGLCRRYKIPASTTDKVLALDGLVGKSLYLTCEKQLSVKLNGSSDALLLGSAADEGGELALSNSNITSISVSNAGSETVLLKVSIA